MDQAFQPAPMAPASPAVPPHRPPSPIAAMAIVAAVFIFVGVVGLILLQKQQTAGPVTEPTPTPTVSTAQQKTLSPIATESAFMQFETAVATLSAAVAAYSPIDQTLVPPALVLPLGY